MNKIELKNLLFLARLQVKEKDQDKTIEKLQNLVRIADIIDVSGALETNKVKDINKIKNFISEVKRINYENKEKSPFN